MMKIVSDRYMSIIENIKRLPVIASQDQEFWLAATISCPDFAVRSSVTSVSTEASALSPSRLLQIYVRCIAAYKRLPNQAALPKFRQIVAEAIEARERIFHLRASKLFRFLNGVAKQGEENRPLVRQMFEIAQCLAVFPCDFLRDWCSHLDSCGGSPSEGAALATFDAIDCNELLRALNAASLEGRKALVEGYLRYSLRLARNRINSGLRFEDLVQEAALGLVVAATKFDFLEHQRFALFATTWMWQHITRALANDSRIVRLPVHAVQKLRDVQKQLRQEAVARGGCQWVQDLVESAGLDPEACMPLLEAEVLPIRLDDPGPAFSKPEVEAFRSRNDQGENQDEGLTHAAFMRLIRDVLSQQQADVIELRFGLGAEGREATLEEIGQKYDVTRERIRQVEKKALEILSRGAHRLRLRGLERAVVHAGPADCEPQSRRPNAISCEEALDPSHPYEPDDGLKLDAMLRRAFGSRQTLVRQSITIKGQLSAVFAVNGEAMHTSRISAILQELYPSERHQETTLYSVMMTNPDAFLSLGAAVFASVAVERNLIARGDYRLPFCPGLSGDTAIVTTGLSIMLNELRARPQTFDLREAIVFISEALRGEGEPPEWYRQNLAFLLYALGLIRHAEFISSGTLSTPRSGVSAEIPDMVASLLERVSGMLSFCTLLESLQPVSQAALARRFSDFYELGRYDCPNRLSLLLQLGVVERTQNNFSLTQEGWRIVQSQSMGEHNTPRLLDMFVAEHLATVERREMDELFEQLIGKTI